MIKLKNVCKYYNNNGNVTIGLRNINLSFKKGEIVAIVGESGSGKSTLLNVICGVDTYEDGELYFNGESTSYFNQQDMDLFRKKHVAFIYQQYNLIDSYTVLENVMIPYLINGYSYNEAKIKSIEIIEKVGLASRINNKGIHLSGGEKQRCVIARALASDFDILACDEPTGNLDSKTGKQIIDLIKEIAKDKLVLIVTHNYEEIEDIATRVITIADGEVHDDVTLNTVTEGCSDIVNKKDTNKVPFSTSLRFAYQNLKNTPRKSVFACLLMLVLSFVVFFLMLSYMSYLDSRNYVANKHYMNTMDNRLVVFNKDHTPLDMEDFEDINADKFGNAFYMDDIFTAYYSYKGNKIFLDSVISPVLPSKYTIIDGEVNKTPYDVFIVFPTSMLTDETYSIEVGGQLKFNEFKGVYLDIAGYGSSDKITNITLVTNVSKGRFYADTVYKSKDLVVSCMVDGIKKETVYQRLSIDKPYVYVEGLEAPNITELNILVKQMYNVSITDFDFNYVYSEVSEYICIYIPMQYEFEQVFELTMFVYDDIDKIKSDIEDMGYCVVLPGKSGSLNTTEDLIYLVFMILICLGTSIIFSFIIYIIYLRIYATKKHDFSVLRSQGLVKSQMAKIVNIEMTFMGVICSIINYILFNILYSMDLEVFSIMKYNSLSMSILYFIVVLGLSNILALRFNKKVFKYSLSTSFKGDEVVND